MKGSNLKKDLNLLEVFCIASGAMISSGLFILPGLAHALAGPAVVFSYIIAGLMASTGMLSQAELVSAMPRAGGTYFYVTRSMGPALGTVDGILEWFSISLKSSFALVGMAAFTQALSGVDIRVVGVVLCLVFVVMNIIGVKAAGRFQVGLVVVLFLLIVIYILRGLPSVNLVNFGNPLPNGVAAVFSTAGFVFVSYGGILKATSIAEEVKRPTRTVPMGMILSLVTVTILYAFTVFVTSGVLSNDALNNSLTPISDGAAAFMGPAGVIIMGIAAILAFVSTANAGIMAASRYPMALSRDRLLPDVLSKVNKRTKTPVVAILFTGAFMMAVLFLKLEVLVELASTVLIMTFMFSCLCVIIMRESGVANYRPHFRSPGYPWVQIFGIFGCWLLVVNMGKQALIFGSVFFAAGLAVYWFYGRARTKRDFALLHLIEKAAARDFLDVSLESELKEILLERYEAVKDRFDSVIESCTVLDIGKEISRDELFDIVAGNMSSQLDIDAGQLRRLLQEREEQASTVLVPGLAIPHIIIKGERRFNIMMARCREGAVFPGVKGKVFIVFVIMGTRDERDFHLRALSAIAQIVEDPDFKKRWMEAKGESDLRDLVLLAKRKR